MSLARNMSIELAKLDNGDLIYGTYEECEAYAEEIQSWVIKYFDHVWVLRWRQSPDHSPLCPDLVINGMFLFSMKCENSITFFFLIFSLFGYDR